MSNIYTSSGLNLFIYSNNTFLLIISYVVYTLSGTRSNFSKKLEYNFDNHTDELGSLLFS